MDNPNSFLESSFFKDLYANAYSGTCRQAFIFCCEECKKIIFSFEPYKRAAYISAKKRGWNDVDQLWRCPDCSLSEEEL